MDKKQGSKSDSRISDLPVEEGEKLKSWLLASPKAIISNGGLTAAMGTLMDYKPIFQVTTSIINSTVISSQKDVRS